MDVHWDLSRERPTLGGLLTLLAEANMRVAPPKDEPLDLYIWGSWPPARNWRDQAMSVISSHAGPVTVHEMGHRAVTNSGEGIRNRPYYDLYVINQVFSATGALPSLVWNDSTNRLVSLVRSQLPRQSVAVHLKNSDPYRLEESNADGSVWGAALSEFLNQRDRAVVLIGDDPIPPEIDAGKGLIRGADLGLNLGLQLALVGKCCGFVGTASGIACAAIYGRNPYVVFKHPSHDAIQMEAELGDGNRLSFSQEGQEIRRSEPDSQEVWSAMEAMVEIA